MIMNINQIDASSESLRIHDEASRIEQVVSDSGSEVSLERLRTRIRRWHLSVSDEPPGPLFRGTLSEPNAVVAAGGIAKALYYAGFHGHKTAGDAKSIDEIEMLFEGVLSLLRLACLTEKKDLTAAALETLTGSLIDAISEEATTSDPSDDTANALKSIRLTTLIHRICAVAAAVPRLQLRQHTARSASSLAGIASRRDQLLMDGLPNAEETITSFTGYEEGDRIAVVAYAVEVVWVDRPNRPYSRVLLANGEELRVHFKNIRRTGIVGNVWIWARCKVEGVDEVSGRLYAVAEFEGPTTKAGECWENWLQVEAGEEYQFTPQSVHLFTSKNDHSLDLFSRIEGKVSEEEEV